MNERNGEQDREVLCAWTSCVGGWNLQNRVLEIRRAG